jgi:hypothetical protein
MKTKYIISGASKQTIWDVFVVRKQSQSMHALLSVVIQSLFV